MRRIQPFCTVQLGLASGQRVTDGDAFVFVLQGADPPCLACVGCNGIIGSHDGFLAPSGFRSHARRNRSC